MDEKDLKAQGLLERIAQIVTRYEDEIADLRVQFTLVGQSAEDLAKQLEVANNRLQEMDEDV